MGDAPWTAMVRTVNTQSNAGSALRPEHWRRLGSLGGAAWRQLSGANRFSRERNYVGGGRQGPGAGRTCGIYPMHLSVWSLRAIRERESFDGSYKRALSSGGEVTSGFRVLFDVRRIV